MIKPTTRLLNRVTDAWRDRVLTGLAVLMALDLFVVAPLGSLHALDLRPISVVLVIVLASALAVLSRSIAPIIAVLAAFCLFAATLFLHNHGGTATLDASLQATAWLLTSFVIIWVVARAVFEEGRITYHRILGAILLYLTIGFLFVALYTLIGAFSPGSFQGLSVTERDMLPSDLVYFSFTTLTTVGYGDIVPVHPLARGLSNAEAIIGQLYPATLLARLVSLGARPHN